MTTHRVTVPVRGPGHCEDDAAWAEFVRQYDGQPRSRPDLTDFALANRVFMADRNDLDLIVWQTAAKERIRWLSIELAKAQSAMLSAAPAPEGGAVSETELRDAIALILPMAKGYAAAHPVGSNQSYVDYVQDLIAAREEV